MTDGDWDQVMAGVRDIVQWHGDGMLFIGGVAVYMHATQFDEKNILEQSFVEFSHDIDFMISMPEFADLRDIEDVTQNSRLSKHQIVKRSIEYDVYVEQGHNLCISYADAFASRKIIDGVPVACLEHLLALKMKAYEDRANSSKGQKDRRDIVKIVAMMDLPERDEILDACLNINLEELQSVSGSTAFMEICNKNSFTAKALRSLYVENLEKIRQICESSDKDRCK